MACSYLRWLIFYLNKMRLDVNSEGQSIGVDVDIDTD